MHNLALALKAAGHTVTGSDDEIYEPSRGRLEAAGLLPTSWGWFPEKITPDLDLVVLGMHARVDNPELVRSLELGLTVKSFPEVVYELSKTKRRVVVAGSHGKTTTTGMIAFALANAGVPADRMIGAMIVDLPPVEFSDAEVIVLEGDEYLSSPLDRRPKFVHYAPDILVITGIAWDHMNVFPTYESYLDAFRSLIRGLKDSATLIYCADDPELVTMISEIRPACTVVPYGVHPHHIANRQVILEGMDEKEYSLQVFGSHNMQNLSAALHVCLALGVSASDFYRGIQSFTGAHKRLQLLFREDQVTAYHDFAHAPSKVKATVQAVRELHPHATIITCLELHTYSSLNPAFLPQYKDTLKGADHKLVYFSPHTLEIKKLPGLSADQLSQHFNDDELKVVTAASEIEPWLTTLKVEGEIVLLWMSSGRFDGLNLPDLSRSIIPVRS